MVLAGDIALWVAFLGCLLFVVGYGITAPFYRHEEGRHLFSFTLFLAAVMGYVAYASANRVIDPPNPGIRFAVFAGMAVFAVWRLWILVRRQVIDWKREKARVRKRRETGASRGSQR